MTDRSRRLSSFIDLSSSEADVKPVTVKAKEKAK